MIDRKCPHCLKALTKLIEVYYCNHYFTCPFAKKLKDGWVEVYSETPIVNMVGTMDRRMYG